MKHSKFSDVFKESRKANGYDHIDDQNDPAMMILGHKNVRKCAHNWKTFQSGAEPGRIVIPSEVNIRSTRQIPFEVDPPLHKAYRDLVEKWFKRPLEDEYKEELSQLISDLMVEVMDKDIIEVVNDFALVLQSRALTLLLNIPFEESELWISWGTHVFRSEDTNLDADKANILYDYIDKQIDKAISAPGNDLYSILLASEVNGKKLTKEEVKGVMILTFAGGRDTIINTVTNTIIYFAEHPEALEKIRNNPNIVGTTIEELIRYFSPLTHMGRVVTENTQVCEHAVKSDTRVSLCWASANRDENVFDNPNDVILDRKINPHVAFGFGTHNCLGATHARQLLRILIMTLAEKIDSITILDAKDHYEQIDQYQRKVGFEYAKVKFNKR